MNMGEHLYINFLMERCFTDMIVFAREAAKKKQWREKKRTIKNKLEKKRRESKHEHGRTSLHQSGKVLYRHDRFCLAKRTKATLPPPTRFEKAHKHHVKHFLRPTRERKRSVQTLRVASLKMLALAQPTTFVHCLSSRKGKLGVSPTIRNFATATTYVFFLGLHREAVERS